MTLPDTMLLEHTNDPGLTFDFLDNYRRIIDILDDLNGYMRLSGTNPYFDVRTGGNYTPPFVGYCHQIVQVQETGTSPWEKKYLAPLIDEYRSACGASAYEWTYAVPSTDPDVQAKVPVSSLVLLDLYSAIGRWVDPSVVTPITQWETDHLGTDADVFEAPASAPADKKQDRIFWRRAVIPTGWPALGPTIVL